MSLQSLIDEDDACNMPYQNTCLHPVNEFKQAINLDKVSLLIPFSVELRAEIHCIISKNFQSDINLEHVRPQHNGSSQSFADLLHDIFGKAIDVYHPFCAVHLGKFNAFFHSARPIKPFADC